MVQFHFMVIENLNEKNDTKNIDLIKNMLSQLHYIYQTNPSADVI